MMLKLTPEQYDEINRAGEAPLSFIDPETKTEYVVLKAEAFEIIKRLAEEVEPSLYEFEEADPV